VNAIHSKILAVHDPKALRVTTVEESRNVVWQRWKTRPEPRVTSSPSTPEPQSTLRSGSLEDGGKAFDLIKRGAARAKLDAFVKFTSNSRVADILDRISRQGRGNRRGEENLAWPPHGASGSAENPGFHWALRAKITGPAGHREIRRRVRARAFFASGSIRRDRPLLRAARRGLLSCSPTNVFSWVVPGTFLRRARRATCRLCARIS